MFLDTGASMKVIVVGSGLAGLISGYFLILRGASVTVVDRRYGPGLETSYANGSLLTPSMSRPWIGPKTSLTVLASIGKSDAAFRLRLSRLLTMAKWGVTALWRSRQGVFEHSTLNNLRLDLHSRVLMRDIRRTTGITYAHEAGGEFMLAPSPDLLAGHAWEAHCEKFFARFREIDGARLPRTRRHKNRLSGTEWGVDIELIHHINQLCDRGSGAWSQV